MHLVHFLQKISVADTCLTTEQLKNYLMEYVPTSSRSQNWHRIIQDLIQTQFLGSDLNINKMYDLYVDSCRAKKDHYVKAGVYRNVFCSEFNSSFHQPKKDQCAKCEQNINASEEEKVNLFSDHSQHIERKNRARSEKVADKEKAAANQSVTALSVD